MNKYNIRAIRKELDGSLRSGSWCRLRSKLELLQGGDAELFRAVVEHRPKSSSGGGPRGSSLLHTLCSSPCCPASIVDIVASSVPMALLLTDRAGRTPLHVAVEKGAPVDVLGYLLRQDAVAVGKAIATVDCHGDTPLLLALRSRTNEEIVEDVVRLLLRHDQEGRSLLIVSRKRCVAPIWYVASSESRFVVKRDDDLPEMTKFFILRTYAALLRHCRRYNGDSIVADDRAYSLHDEDDFVDGGSDVCILQATIGCAHLLEKFAPKILQMIFSRGLYHRDRLSSRPDQDGHLTLHLACISRTSLFGRNLNLIEGSDDTDLIEHLIRLCPSALRHPNIRMDLPLHLALRGGKDWIHVNSLLNAYPRAVRCFNSLGELPLHVAIKCSTPCSGIARELWMRYPDTATIRDGQTRLYPFQLAACYESRKSGTVTVRDVEGQSAPMDKGVIKKSRRNGGEAATDPTICDLTAVYSFLRDSPQVLQHFLQE